MANTTAAVDPEVEMASDDGDCKDDRQWYAFLCSSLITFFAGLFLVLLGRVVSWLLCCGRGPGTAADGGGGAVKLVTASDDSRHADRGDAATEDGAQIGWATEAKDWAGELISGQSTTGRILVCVFCMQCSLLSLSASKQTNLRQLHAVVFTVRLRTHTHGLAVVSCPSVCLSVCQTCEL